MSSESAEPIKKTEQTSLSDILQVFAMLCGIACIYGAAPDRKSFLFYVGTALCSYGLLWSWRLGRLAIGRILATGGLIVLLVLDSYQAPVPPEVERVRGPASSFQNAQFNISGVVPGMSLTEIENLFGPGVGDDKIRRYPNEEVSIILEGGVCVQVEGKSLLDGSKELLRVGEPESKMTALFGETALRHRGYCHYKRTDPDLQVKISDDHIEEIQLLR